MQIVVVADEMLKTELLKSVHLTSSLTWFDSLETIEDYKDADAIIDFTFTNHSKTIDLLKQFLPKIIIVNSVVNTLEEIHPSFVRINGWNSLIQKNVVEASGEKTFREGAENVLAIFNKEIQWLPDEPGFVTPKIISMIINEAYLLVEEKICSREDIDLAMKEGTNYPFGPFEWADKIGLHTVCSLLQKLAERDSSYQPSALLRKEAF